MRLSDEYTICLLVGRHESNVKYLCSGSIWQYVWKCLDEIKVEIELDLRRRLSP